MSAEPTPQKKPSAAALPTLLFILFINLVGFGIVVFIVSYLAGHYIPPLFGHAPVSVGG